MSLALFEDVGVDLLTATIDTIRSSTALRAYTERATERKHMGHVGYAS